ncbi:hypothetical protein CL89_gp076 [Aeromonas phage PX29]|uniref:Uncharacterized protein n=1 Tax=Aeromonas phage PX29 TaxID=926067 RepID=E5DQ09_9CAUD|nr:hypothetical protein CL89_gp076 [Aeromonas phage PX29]ADQ52795.1 conserved hypothetical protein [Aeromonas phage PX29]
MTGLGILLLNMMYTISIVISLHGALFADTLQKRKNSFYFFVAFIWLIVLAQFGAKSVMFISH